MCRAVSGWTVSGCIRICRDVSGSVELDCIGLYLELSGCIGECRVGREPSKPDSTSEALPLQRLHRCQPRCPTCRQEFTGEVDVGLARARWERVRDRPPEDEERLFVALNLAVTLKESADDSLGALRLMEEVLAVRRRVWAHVPDHPDVLDAVPQVS